ncbi:MAG: putative entry exclusion protein TrbK-alt [Rhodospirillales bacterium]|nr:putative entry exclusion protein TrbK-alt [Rhodospirillales bacterium]
MNAKVCVFIGISYISMPAWAGTPTVDQLVANPTMLNAEMDRCTHLGMAANDDVRCQTAWQAENKRFFGNGTTYTKQPVNVFPNTPTYVSPGQTKAASGNPSHAGPKNGK